MAVRRFAAHVRLRVRWLRCGGPGALMTIAEKLSEIVMRSRSVDELLESAVRTIADELHADACSLFLLEPGEPRLRLHAASGDRRGRTGHAETAQAAAEGLAGVALTQMLPETREERSRSLLAVPMALRGQPIGRDRRSGEPRDRVHCGRDPDALRGRVADGRHHGGRAPDRGRGARRRARDAAAPGRSGAAHFARGSTCSRGSPFRPGSRSDRPCSAAHLQSGTPVSLGGRTTAPRSAPASATPSRRLATTSRASRMPRPAISAKSTPSSSPPTWSCSPIRRFTSASRRPSRPVSSAPEAIDTALLEIADRLRGARDPYLQERVEDIDDLRSRLLGHMLTGEPLSSSRAQVVVAPRIAPSLVIEMKAQAARAIVAQNGGATSHGALLARSLGIPAVAGVEDALDATDAGDIVDRRRLRGRRRRPTDEGDARAIRARGAAAGPAAHRVREIPQPPRRPRPTAYASRFLANVAFGADIALAKENGAEGHRPLPDRVPVHRARRLPDARRTGADLPQGVRRIPGCPGHPPDPRSRGRQVRLEPRRGRRAWRIPRVPLDPRPLRLPHVLRDQVQAFALAAGGRPLRILVPMVSSLEELLRIQEMTARAIGQIAEATRSATRASAR